MLNMMMMMMMRNQYCRANPGNLITDNVFHLQKNPSTIRIPEDDIGSDSHIMDHVVSLTSTDVLDKNLTELCRDAGKVLFKGTDPKLLLSGMQCSATREFCEGSLKVLQDEGCRVCFI